MAKRKEESDESGGGVQVDESATELVETHVEVMAQLVEALDRNTNSNRNLEQAIEKHAKEMAGLIQIVDQLGQFIDDLTGEEGD